MENTAYLGIDVSKGYADFILLGPGKNILEKTFQLTDSVEGRKRLLSLIQSWFDEGLQTLYCGVESTGGYEDNWYRMLKGMSGHYNVKTARLNPKAVMAVSDASMRRSITDAVSAENIAIYLIAFSDKIQYENLQGSQDFKEGRTQYSFIRMIVKQKVQLLNQLEKVLYQYFPEVLRYCRRRMPAWLLQMLIKYPCAQSALKAGVTRLSAINGITKSKAEALLQKFEKRDVPVSEAIRHVITRTARMILQNEEMIESEKQFLSEQYKEHPDVVLLQSIPGIGLDTAALIMIEIEDVHRFDTAARLCAYFGVHPSYKQSGDGMWKTGMSKKGRGQIRAALYMSGMTGLRFNPLLKQVYARFRAKGMKHYQAMGVVMHKLLRIIYGVLKSKKAFDAQVDHKNVARAEEKKEQKQKEQQQTNKEQKQSKNRFQPINIEGPISRRTADKIIKQIAS